MARPILVTGGSGFIGSHVIRMLVERGDEVINFDTRPFGPEAAWWMRDAMDGVTFAQGSMETLSDLAFVMRRHEPDRIIHIAAITNPVLLNTNPTLAFRVNLGGALNVLEAARIFEIERVVNFSSIGVLPGVRYAPIDVDHPVLLGSEGPGASFYGAAKIGAEAFCWAYHQSYGLDFVTIRPSAVYGFGMQWPIYIKPIVENAVNGQPTSFPHGRDFPRDYTHVQDVAQLAVKALDAPPDLAERVFFGATGEKLSTPGLVADIVRETIPEADIQIGEGLSDDDLIEIRYREVMDISNGRELLGYDPAYADIHAGVAEYIETYRAYLADTGDTVGA